MQETGIGSPSQEKSPGKGNGDPPSILAWEIPWTEEPGSYTQWGHEGVEYD